MTSPVLVAHRLPTIVKRRRAFRPVDALLGNCAAACSANARVESRFTEVGALRLANSAIDEKVTTFGRTSPRRPRAGFVERLCPTWRSSNTAPLANFRLCELKK